MQTRKLVVLERPMRGAVLAIAWLSMFGLTWSSLAGAASAQEVGQSDVQVRALSVRPSASSPGNFEVKATVYTDNDDDAQDVRLLVFLPPETSAVSLPSNCTTTANRRGYVSCSLGSLRVGQSSERAFTVSTTPIFVLPRFTAFAYSPTPDPDLGNNSRDVIEDGTVVRETSQAQVYVLFGRAKFHIPDPATLSRLYGGWANVRVVRDGTVANYARVPSDGTILVEDGKPEVWRFENGTRRQLTLTELASYGGWAVVGRIPSGTLP